MNFYHEASNSASTDLGILSGRRVRYDHYKVYGVKATTLEQIEALITMENSDKYRFLEDIGRLNRTVRILVPPQLADNFVNEANASKLETKLYTDNVQRVLDRQRAENEKAAVKGETFGWKKYYDLEAINKWLYDLQNRYPHVVKVVKGGKTYEGRDVLGVHLSYSDKNANKANFIEGGIHADEWIGPATVTYFLNELLTSKNARIRAIAETHDWYIFPVFNPDGYQYSHTTDQTWRKTRTPQSDKCYGADPNRNWDFHWGTIGNISTDPCSDRYIGANAFSEPTVRSLSEYLKTIGHKLKAYIAFHSNAQMLMIPYGHTTELLDNYQELHSVGLKALKALSKRYGTKYELGNVPQLLYKVSGDSVDWVKSNFKTRVTYTYELRPDLNSPTGYLPPSEIIPNCLEVVDSLVTIFEEFK